MMFIDVTMAGQIQAHHSLTGNAWICPTIVMSIHILHSLNYGTYRKYCINKPCSY